MTPDPSTTPPTKGELARTAIMEAGRRLFIQKGYSATSMRDIAQEAGARAVGGIYNHFPTKEAIFQAVFNASSPYDEFLPILEAVQADNVTDFVRQAFSQVLRIMVEHYEFFELLQIDLREFQGANMQALMASGLMERGLTSVARLQSLPGLRDINPLVLVRWMAGIAIGYSATQRFAPSFLFSHIPGEAWVTHYVELLLHGISADSPDLSASSQEGHDEN